MRCFAWVTLSIKVVTDDMLLRLARSFVRADATAFRQHLIDESALQLFEKCQRRAESMSSLAQMRCVYLDGSVIVSYKTRRHDVR